jgi:hypothetical protein
MADGLTIKSETLSGSLARILATTKREAPIVLREQGRGILRHLQAHTPPGHSGVTGQSAKQHGEKKIESDIRKVMYGVKKRVIGMRTDIAAIHREARNPRNGRVARTRGQEKIAVSASALNTYIGSKKKMVGFLASGWNSAAAKLGVKPPQWMWRHKGEGSIREAVTETSITITATNSVGFASKAITQKDRLLRFAYNAQKSANDRRWENFMATQAKRAGLKAS